MFPYLLAFMYILGICLLSSEEEKRFYKQELLNQVKQEEANLHSYEKSLVAEAHYFDFVNIKKKLNEDKDPSFKKIIDKKENVSKSSNQKRSRALEIDITRPPNNSRINLYAFLLESEFLRLQQFSWYSILSRLIIQEYLTKDSLNEYTEEDVEHLLLAIIDNKQFLLDLCEKDPSPDILFQLSLEDKFLSKFMNRLLSGGEDFSSILCFLDFSPKKSLGFCKLNFLFLDSCILKAIFNNPSVENLLKGIQETVFSEILSREKEFLISPKQEFKGRSEFKLELKEAVSSVLVNHGYDFFVEKNFFDFSLGKIGSYFLIKKPENPYILRLKYFYSENNWIEGSS